MVLIQGIYGPYFACSGQECSSSLLFVMPVVFSIVLTALVNIQARLEKPIDQFGEDDVMFNTGRFIASSEQD